MKGRELPEDPSLTPGQVADFLGVSTRSVHNFIGKGSMPSLRVGRLVRVPRERFLRWYEERCNKGVL